MLLSIVSLCASTSPSLKVNMTLSEYADYFNVEPEELVALWWENMPGEEIGIREQIGIQEEHDNQEANLTHNGSSWEQYPISALLNTPHPTLMLIDISCYLYFIMELIFNTICCPSPRRFFSSFLNIIDTISVVLFIVEIAINNTHIIEIHKMSIVDALFVLRVLRVFRICRLAKHHKGLEVLIYTLKASFREILLLLLFLFIGVLVFGSIIYCTDHNTNSKFNSIGTSFWWAIITMTTVGYGDMVPTSDLGKVVGALCAVSGVMLIGFTVPIIVNNFLLFYSQVQYGKRIEWLEKRNRMRWKKRPTMSQVMPDISHDLSPSVGGGSKPGSPGSWQGWTAAGVESPANGDLVLKSMQKF